MTPEAFVRRAIMVPFVDLGRDYAGWDCWGLVRCYWRDVLGVELPSHATDYSGADDDAVIARLLAEGRSAWLPVEDRRPGDVALFRKIGRPVHVGIVIGPRRFLHAERAIGTAIERFDHPLWARQLEGVYRYAGARCTHA